MMSVTDGNFLACRCCHPITSAKPGNAISINSLYVYLMAIVDFPELKALLVHDGRLMALDVGTRTIGIATSDVLRTLATPLTTLKRGKLSNDLVTLAELASK